ncbi:MULTISPECIES: site-specific DNA-methyltransferase [Anaerolinea]|uniref:DNA-methyltransferase n=1 Tax=Anaerolinea TaxID=233189 RepID=UPI00260A1F62|nr:DNA methyltransferase [Anaerolinea thermophila]
MSLTNHVKYIKFMCARYSTLPLNQILQGDCRDILPDLPDRSVDLIFADPPYNLQLQQDLYRPDRSRVEAVNDAWDQFSSFSEYDEFSQAWLKECRRVLKDDGALWVIGTYHNIFRIGTILQDLGFWILNDVIWIKTNPMPNFRGVRFTNAHETLIWAVKSRDANYIFNHHAMKALNDDLQMRSDWYIPICSGPERIRINGKKIHSTQKPEALLYRIILATTRPGDVILDPFFGTGTTGAVAQRLGRNWIGIEQELQYIQAARERIARVNPAPADALSLPVRSRKSRLPFGTLVEHHLIKPGQILYFDRNPDIRAMVLSNGHLSVDGWSGSIHMAAEKICGRPTNGWERWYFLDEHGNFQPVAVLKQKFLSGISKEDDLKENL